MDRSFLSDAAVVDASRNFVCIRLATYEDQAEADFMTSLYVGRSRQLENTTFAILSPDGKRKLTTAGRGPFHAFRQATSMASGMNRIAAEHSSGKNTALTDIHLPLMKNLDLALNVAAADGLPLQVTVGDDRQQLDELNQKLVRTAWDADFAGQFVYASVNNRQELKPVTGVKDNRQILVIEPGPFGLSGKVVAQFASGENQKSIAATLHEVVKNLPRKEKGHDPHVRLGIQLGISWQSQIPETDPMSLHAKQRVRGREAR